MLTYASPGCFPFLCNTATNHLEVLHRAACRVITGYLSSIPSSLLLLEAQLPPLKLTLEYQLFPPSNVLCVSPQTSPISMPWQQETCPVNYRRNPSGDHSVLRPHNHSHPHVRLRSCAPLFPHGLQPTSLFPPSFPTAQATIQPDSSLLQTDYPSSPLLISKYGLMVVFPLFLVPVVMKCISHAPNATHPIPCPFLLVQLPPALQMKPLPSSKVSIGVLTI